jgi:hypothetical protein
MHDVDDAYRTSTVGAAAKENNKKQDLSWIGVVTEFGISGKLFS